MLASQPEPSSGTSRTSKKYCSPTRTCCAAVVHELLHATDVVEPLQAVTRTLAGFSWENLAPRESHRRRDAMIASNPELERELIEQQQMTDGFSTALHQRGVDPDIAEHRRARGHPSVPYGLPAMATGRRQRRPGNDDRNRDVPPRHDRAPQCFDRPSPGDSKEYGGPEYGGGPVKPSFSVVPPSTQVPTDARSPRGPAGPK
jgi:hypothetical protein